jgi:bifunctional UDP-N-acetylglucosamine pyrophosphorylase/glucosamine-1-phosphate N-acetyltransferase
MGRFPEALMTDFALAIVVLAAGAGTRMCSDIPKPLHRVGGLSLLGHVLALAQAASPERLAVVAGQGFEAVASATRALAPGAAVVEQAERLGTGHAVRCAAPALDGFVGEVLVLYADTPLLRSDTVARLRAAVAGGGEEGAAIAVLGFEPADPGGYGRLILDGEGGLARIVEAKDATAGERAVRLCNSGVMAFRWPQARAWLDGLSAANAKGEYYLTDLAAAARMAGEPASVVLCPEEETLGVNDRLDLAAAEAAFQRRARAVAMRGGVTLVAPETVFLSHDTILGRDVTIGPNVVFGPGVTVEDGAEIGAFSWLEGCVVRAGAAVGPYARLRPGAEIGQGARVGNFVEVKNATLDRGAKVNHLSYLGDATVGRGANIGAGTITCNYDGYGKYRTAIGAEAFIGSNTALVAPVAVGEGANVAAGSTITADVAPGALALARARQVVKPGYAARLRALFAKRKAGTGR